MRDGCLDEGVLQSYLDGELSLSMTEQVAGHVAACASCAEQLREAESELSVFSAALAPEMSLGVPSEQLRVRVNAAVENLEAARYQPAAAERESRFGSWLGSLLTSFTPQQAAGFAGLVLMIGFGILFF
ncbi:MAG TPA: zf-HC2 domain-containing protein, partial [Pyrinomonadaceae bacterium]